MQTTVAYSTSFTQPWGNLCYFEMELFKCSCSPVLTFHRRALSGLKFNFTTNLCCEFSIYHKSYATMSSPQCFQIFLLQYENSCTEKPTNVSWQCCFDIICCWDLLTLVFACTDTTLSYYTVTVLLTFT